MIYAPVVCASTAPISGGCGVTDRSSTVCVEGKVAACAVQTFRYEVCIGIFSCVAFKGSEAALKLVKNTPGQVFSPVVKLLLC